MELTTKRKLLHIFVLMINMHNQMMINMHHQMMINMILIISGEGRVVGRVAAYLRHQMMISHICSIQTPSDRIFPTFDKVRGGRLYCKGRNSHF